MEKVKLQAQYGLYINGEWRNASDGATYNAESPADGSHLAVCAQGSREDVEAASAAAWEAFKTWKKTTPAQRAALLNKIADIIDANKEHLAMVESMDNGKPIRETMNVDIPMAAEHFRYFAGCILAEGRILGETAALLYTAGFAHALYGSLGETLQGAGATLSVALYVYAKEQGEFDVAFAIAAILMALALLIDLAASLTGRYFKKRRSL